MNIPKPDGGTRPLGVAAIEDKIVQKAVAEIILTPIYEAEFLGSSYGFRPGRGAHDALDALAAGIKRRKINWVVDCDIRAFFDNVSRNWLVRFLEHRIADKRVIRLIIKWLNAGVMEDGEWRDNLRGTPQGSVASPVLANIYLHYVLDLWFQKKWRSHEVEGDAIIVRYADDFVVGFQHKRDAERFLNAVKERFESFELDIHPDKTRLIEFGRFACPSSKHLGHLGLFLNGGSGSSWLMLSCLVVMGQAAFFDGQVFDLSSSLDDGVVPAEVDVGGGEVGEAFVVAAVVVVLDEGADAGLEIARQISSSPAGHGSSGSDANARSCLGFGDGSVRRGRDPYPDPQARLQDRRRCRTSRCR